MEVDPRQLLVLLRGGAADRPSVGSKRQLSFAVIPDISRLKLDQVAAKSDDPYRSLVGALKRAGGYEEQIALQ